MHSESAVGCPSDYSSTAGRYFITGQDCFIALLVGIIYIAVFKRPLLLLVMRKFIMNILRKVYSNYGYGNSSVILLLAHFT